MRYAIYEGRGNLLEDGSSFECVSFKAIKLVVDRNVEFNL